MICRLFTNVGGVKATSTFKPNTEFAKKKIAKNVYFLQRMKRRIDKDTKLTLYKTLIVPHIDYCSTMLLLTNESEYREIQVIFNRSLRSILLEDPCDEVDCEMKDFKSNVKLYVKSKYTSH